MSEQTRAGLTAEQLIPILREVAEECAKVAEFEHSVGTNGIGIAAAIRHWPHRNNITPKLAALAAAPALSSGAPQSFCNASHVETEEEAVRHTVLVTSSSAQDRNAALLGALRASREWDEALIAATEEHVRGMRRCAAALDALLKKFQ